MSINRKTLPSSGEMAVTDRSSGSARLLCAARKAGLEMSAWKPLDKHRNLHAALTGNHEKISEIKSSGNDGSIVGDALVDW
jgi:hypothetical protein